MRTRLRRPKEVEVLPQLLHSELGVKIARSFRSAASRCASADFTPFPLSPFGAMAEVVEKVDGVVMLVAMGGRSALSRLREEGGAAEFLEDGVVATSEGERTAPVSSAYKEGRGGRFALPNKEPPTISPTTPHSTRAVRGERGGYGARFGVAQSACARALSWAWPNSARHRVWPRPGGSCRCTRIGVP